MADRTFHSFGFGESAQGSLEEPDRLRFFDAVHGNGPLLPRGAGVSLAGASFGPGVRALGMRHFNRVLAFDDAAGTVTVESGATLATLFGFLARKGWMIAVQPGYPGVTVGGCIAGNVHGKSQYEEGCFGDWVEELELWHPRHGRLMLSPTRESDLFALTIGGFGLTGVILSARLRLAKLKGRGVALTALPVGDIGEAATVMKEHRGRADFLYTWHDMAWSPRGRGFVFVGKLTAEGPEVPVRASFHRFDQERFTLPVGLMNRWSLSAMNCLYSSSRRSGVRQLSLWNAMFPFAAIPAYFYLYGRRGFLEHQVVIPEAAFATYIPRLRALAGRHRVPFGLAAMKLFRGPQRLLTFSGDGISLAIEAPQSSATRALFADIDLLDVALGCRANILKDARLPAAAVARQYPEHDVFRDRLTAFDPARIFRSSLSLRIGL
ncbi:MAG: FAD-binding oxidoreductase [Rhodospirillales bacterium]|nr:FAD-binding oxidoreductase [Rhodospirillales bacterium]